MAFVKIPLEVEQWYSSTSKAFIDLDEKLHEQDMQYKDIAYKPIPVVTTQDKVGQQALKDRLKKLREETPSPEVEVLRSQISTLKGQIAVLVKEKADFQTTINTMATEAVALKIKISKLEIGAFTAQDLYTQFQQFMKANSIKGVIGADKAVVTQFLNVIHLLLKEQVVDELAS